MSKLLVAVLTLAAIPPAFAGQATPAPSATAQFGAVRPPQAANPYAKLFDLREAAARALLEVQTRALKPQPTVVCGMAMIPMDPNVDPKIYMAPKNDRVDHKIRAIAPPICKEPRG